MDFMKRSSIGYVTAKGWPDMSKAARKLAEYEGFSSHANAVGPMRTPYLGQGD
jgi:histidinol dehydrogenase